MEYEHVIHPFEPVYDNSSKILILGSLPSVKSREQQFYYGHPRNRFWEVLSAVCGENEPNSIQDKKEFLLRNHIALWDVIYSCDIKGSSDSSIRNALPTDLNKMIRASDITKVYCNGKTAAKLYKQYQKKQTGIEAVSLPSTSPANAAWSTERLIKEWSRISTKE